MVASSLVDILSPLVLTYGSRRIARRRRHRRLRVSEGDGTVREAIEASDEIMRLCQDGAYDGVVQYLADEYLTLRQVDLQDEGKPLLYKYICPDDQRGDGTDNNGKFPTNSYAWRGVLFEPPETWERTSVLQVARTRCLVRYVVKPTISDERVVVNVDMRLEDALKPTYRSIQIAQQWFVHGMIGEPRHDDFAMYVTEGIYTERGHMGMGPETVIMCQLEDFRNKNLQNAWRWNTKRYKKVYKNDVESFENSFINHPKYQTLLAHTSATVLKSIQMSSEKNMTMVGMESTQRAVFLWMMTLDDCGLWRVDAINCLGS